MSSRIIARSSSNRHSASALASSVLPTPVGPRKRKRADRTVRVLQAGPGPAHGRRDGADRLVLADHAPVQLAPRGGPACPTSPSSSLETGTPVHLETIAAISSSPTSSLSMRAVALEARPARRFAARSSALQLGDRAVAQLGRALQARTPSRRVRPRRGPARSAP